MTEPRRIAVVRSYDDLISAVRARVDELNISQLGLDEDCQLTRGHVNKLIGPVPVKSFGRETFGPIFQALGLMLLVVEDPVTIANAAKLVQRRRKASNASDGMLPMKKRKPRGYWHKHEQWSAIQNSRRTLLLPARKRSQIARKAARARWRKEQHQKEERQCKSDTPACQPTGKTSKASKSS